MDDEINHLPCFNVVFGLRAGARVWWTTKPNPDQIINIEVWGVSFYWVDVCRL